MNKELIIQMAREAGISVFDAIKTVVSDKDGLERFFQLTTAWERGQLLKLSTKAHDVDGHCDIVLSADIRARGAVELRGEKV